MYYTVVRFDCIVKYAILFILLFMYLNSIKIQPDEIIKIVGFSLILSITLDLMMFENYFSLFEK